MKNLIEKINYLANKAKKEGLSKEEKSEQEDLRKEYLKEFRGRMKETLLHTKVVNEEGEDITPKKLAEEQKKRRNN